MTPPASTSFTSADYEIRNNATRLVNEAARRERVQQKQQQQQQQPPPPPSVIPSSAPSQPPMQEQSSAHAQSMVSQELVVGDEYVYTHADRPTIESRALESRKEVAEVKRKAKHEKKLEQLRMQQQQGQDGDDFLVEENGVPVTNADGTPLYMSQLHQLIVQYAASQGMSVQQAYDHLASTTTVQDFINNSAIGAFHGGKTDESDLL